MRVGIALASKCQFCGATEDVIHMVLFGLLANEGNLVLAASGRPLRTSGSSIAAFCKFYGIQTSVDAEALANLDGLSLAKKLRVTHIQLKTDSLLLVNVLKDLSCLHGRFLSSFGSLKT
ncbi:hypothetical protein ACH5RR_040829 [Cinchona calisaya]|uniref:RNase H type-1 domain-containing protein n=1 Tax=Cinchona calisaya TaxID=153742 RepID=A0ABD2XUW0_9GENT